MPVRIVQLSTGTSTFPSTNGVDFGDAYRVASYADSSTVADRDIAAVVEGTIGGSPKWQTVLTVTTNSTAASFAILLLAISFLLTPVYRSEILLASTTRLDNQNRFSGSI